jgi:hypothetical protein
MKVSTCCTWRSALRWASLTMSLTPSSLALASRTWLSITMNSEDRLSSDTPRVRGFWPGESSDAAGVSRLHPASATAARTRPASSAAARENLRVFVVMPADPYASFRLASILAGEDHIQAMGQGLM